MSEKISKPIDLVVDALASRIREDGSQAQSLAHILVVVPTAQSGRRLRMALARRFDNGILPPVVCEVSRLLQPPEDVAVAGRAEEIAAFFEALGQDASIDVAAQLSDIRRVIGAKALFFSDIASTVAEKLKGEAAAAEEERWGELAEIEKRYFDVLKKRGKVDRIASLKKVLENPVAPEGIEEVVLACLYDPSPVFNEWLARTALPVTNISLPEPSSIAQPNAIACATGLSEAERIADIFSGVSAEEELPSICVADPDSFAEIEGALKARGFKVHNPAGTALAKSSLGQLTAQIVALSHSRSYAVFSSFIRGGDVRRWICTELNIDSKEFTAALVRLDNAQAKLLPDTIDQIGPKTSGRLRAIFEFVDVQLRKKNLRGILRAIFGGRTLDSKDQDSREFAAAAEALNTIIEECDALSLPGKAAHELFLRRLQEQTYSLEPDEGDVILADGWLELPFVEAGEIIIAGFNEGCVPESVTAHPFLPDSLRRAFDLMDNESRATRDRRILSCAVACREKGAVTALFRAIDSKGDVLKPSRLLFEGLDDEALVDRVEKFYSSAAGTSEAPCADLPSQWRLRPDIPPEYKSLEFTSPSSLDLYLRCPFTYCLKKTFGERTDDRAEELDPSEFGNLVHDALERWGMSELKESENAKEISDALSSHVDALLVERFGMDIPAIVALQGESAKRRLEAFSRIQVLRHKQGWRIVATELRMQVLFKDSNTLVKGRCDRIDYNESTNEWCVIDYKTFDNPDRAAVRDKRGAWKSLQLPLYCSMLDASGEYPDARLENISSCYCILGKTDEGTLFSEAFPGVAVREAEAKVRELIDGIEHGRFWPPSPTKEWEWDFKEWISPSPEETVSQEWIDDQLARMPKSDEREAAK